MLEEEHNIYQECPQKKPLGFARTIISKVDSNNSSENVLKKIRSVWAVVASWGRWCDEELGDWPSREECISALPGWMKEQMMQVEGYEIENWLDDLHDRNWIWWSSSVENSFIKIDIQCESMPISSWMLEFVIEKVGCQVIYRDMWIDRYNP